MKNRRYSGFYGLQEEKVKKKRTMAVQGAFQFCTNG